MGSLVNELLVMGCYAFRCFALFEAYLLCVLVPVKQPFICPSKEINYSQNISITEIVNSTFLPLVF